VKKRGISQIGTGDFDERNEKKEKSLQVSIILVLSKK